MRRDLTALSFIAALGLPGAVVTPAFAYGASSPYGGNNAYGGTATTMGQPSTGQYGSSAYGNARSSNPYSNGLSSNPATATTTAGTPAGAAGAPQTDYQRVMNSVNNSSATALGQPQPDTDAQNDTGNTTPNRNTPVTPAATNTANPVAQTANQNFGNQNFGNYGAATNSAGTVGLGSNNVTPVGRGAPGYNNFNNSVGITNTTGSPGLGAYNASPYNVAPAATPAPSGTTGYPVTPTFTGGSSQ